MLRRILAIAACSLVLAIPALSKPTRVMKNVDQLRALDMSGIGNGPFIWGADNEPEGATYSFGLFGINPGSSPTDFIVIYNSSSSNIIRLKSVVISGQVATAANIGLQQIRRSTADTGGTSVGVTPVNHDTNDGASIATVNYYTAAPSSLGTQVGSSPLHVARMNVAPAANGGVDRSTNWQYTWQNDKAVVIRPGERWCLNLALLSWPSGGVIDVDVLWTEE